MFRELIFAASMIGGAGVALAFEQKDEGVALTVEQEPEGLAQCPEKLVAGQPALHCLCPAEATATGSVWGSDVYTDDSAICRAALHAGVIGTDGGEILVVEAPGLASYPAVTRNSVASGRWPGWRRSIAFRPVSEMRTAEADTELLACPSIARGLAVGTALRCDCTAEAAASGAVWGNGLYTADSAICRAALHADAIGPDGGAVELSIIPGQAEYAASTSNGVISSAWGRYATSIEFRRSAPDPSPSDPTKRLDT